MVARLSWSQRSQLVSQKSSESGLLTLYLLHSALTVSNLGTSEELSLHGLIG